METLDRDVRTLENRKRAWATTPVDEKLSVLGALRRNLGRVADRWVDLATKAKGIPDGSPLVGEEWTSGPYAVASGINALEATLQRIADGRDVLDGFPVRSGPDGRVVVDVFPADLLDRLLLSGHRGEVWMEPSVTREKLGDTVATFYRHPDPPGAVTLVLGAGNIASISPLDLLYRMFVCGDTVILKLSPVNDYLAPVLEEVFAPLIEQDWVRIVIGGAEVGAHLARHDGVDRIHITGSKRTHDAIVFGGDGDTLLSKPMTSELGGVGPTIIVPGPWSDADVAYQAEHVATQKLHNSGFNCISCQVLVLPEGWARAGDLIEAIRSLVARLPGRPPYYPGAQDRMSEIIASHHGAASVPYGVESFVLVDTDGRTTDERGFTNELFAPALLVARLPGDGADEFLANAVRFANERLAGTLGANIIIDPATAKGQAGALDAAVRDLRYGTVAVNSWTGVAFGMPRMPWGGFLGATLDDVQSGIGVVHNALMLEHVERSVVRGPFAPFPRTLRHGRIHLEPRPPTFVTNRQAAVVGERLTRHAVSRSWRHIPGIVTAALRG